MSNQEIDTVRVARIFKALSNPHRLTLFLQMARCVGVGVSLDHSAEGLQQCQLEKAKELGLAPSTVSNHFKELRDSGLIHMERAGKNVRCWIDPQTLELAQSVLAFLPACGENPDNEKE